MVAKSRTILALAVLMWAVEGAQVPSCLAEAVTGEQEEALVTMDLQHNKVVVQHLDGRTRTYELPLPVGWYMPGEGRAIDMTWSGKMAYFAWYSQMPAQSRERPIGVRLDDGSSTILYTGFVSNELNDLILDDIALSPDGMKLALTARKKEFDPKTRPALFCLDLGSGRLIGLTSFQHVARGPIW